MIVESIWYEGRENDEREVFKSLWDREVGERRWWGGQTKQYVWKYLKESCYIVYYFKKKKRNKKERKERQRVRCGEEHTRNICDECGRKYFLKTLGGNKN